MCAFSCYSCVLLMTLLLFMAAALCPRRRASRLTAAYSAPCCWAQGLRDQAEERLAVARSPCNLVRWRQPTVVFFFPQVRCVTHHMMPDASQPTPSLQLPLPGLPSGALPCHPSDISPQHRAGKSNIRYLYK